MRLAVSQTPESDGDGIFPPRSPPLSPRIPSELVPPLFKPKFCHRLLGLLLLYRAGYFSHAQGGASAGLQIHIISLKQCVLNYYRQEARSANLRLLF